ncbi:hypothetical protein ACFL4W_03735 [Planctomycetota bacterium]
MKRYLILILLIVGCAANHTAEKPVEDNWVKNWRYYASEPRLKTIYDIGYADGAREVIEEKEGIKEIICHFPNTEEEKAYCSGLYRGKAQVRAALSEAYEEGMRKMRHVYAGRKAKIKESLQKSRLSEAEVDSIIKEWENTLWYD